MTVSQMIMPTPDDIQVRYAKATTDSAGNAGKLMGEAYLLYRPLDVDIDAVFKDIDAAARARISRLWLLEAHAIAVFKDGYRGRAVYRFQDLPKFTNGLALRTVLDFEMFVRDGSYDGTWQSENCGYPSTHYRIGAANLHQDYRRDSPYGSIWASGTGIVLYVDPAVGTSSPDYDTNYTPVSSYYDHSFLLIETE